MAEKRISFKCEQQKAEMLKEYCAYFEVSMADALNLAWEAAFNTHALHCPKVRSIFEHKGEPLDKRAGRSCFGHQCLACVHRPACEEGIYTGEFEVKPEHEHLAKKQLTYSRN